MKKSVVITNGELGQMFGKTGSAYFTMQSQLQFGGPFENKHNLSVAG
jgi:hypothetical protein